MGDVFQKALDSTAAEGYIDEMGRAAKVLGSLESPLENLPHHVVPHPKEQDTPVSEYTPGRNLHPKGRLTRLVLVWCADSVLKTKRIMGWPRP